MPPREKLFPTTKVSAVNMDALAASAKEASKHAYCPYSKFRVGAAVYARKPNPEPPGTDAEAIFSGCNTENANYTLTLHAEHSAIAKAVELGYTDILAVVIYTPTETATAPCGSCRQVINEFGPRAVVVATCDAEGFSPRWNMSKLLPDAFGPHNLGKG
jgi:cytidine deaminase